MSQILTTREVADLLNVPTWRVQRLFEAGRIPDVNRFAGKRAIPSSMLPQIVDALRDVGCLTVQQGAAHA